MTRATFEGLCNDVFSMIRERAPYDTGNLSIDALRMVYDDENTCRIYIDERIAPYMPYTNEPWVSQYWNGKQNPNLYWWDTCATGAMMMLARTLGGDVEKVRSEFEGVDALADQFQNKRGDYYPEDVLLHSSYIENAGDPAATFDSRLALLLGGI